jgi:hypothetical protein
MAVFVPSTPSICVGVHGGGYGESVIAVASVAFAARGTRAECSQHGRGPNQASAKAGGLSRIVSSIFLYNEMFRRRPDLAAVLFEPLCFDRRGEVPAGKKGFYTTPIFHWYADQLSVIYGNRYYIESAQRFSDASRLTAKQIEALDLFDALANDRDREPGRHRAAGHQDEHPAGSLLRGAPRPSASPPHGGAGLAAGQHR